VDRIRKFNFHPKLNIGRNSNLPHSAPNQNLKPKVGRSLELIILKKTAVSAV